MPPTLKWLLAPAALLRQILETFDRRDRFLFVGLLAMMIIGAAVEVIGIGALTVFIAAIAQPDRGMESALLRPIARLIDGGVDARTVGWLGAGLVALFFVKNVYLAFLAHVQVHVVFNKEVRLSRDLLAGYLQEPYLFFLRHNSAQLIRNVTHEVSHYVNGIILPGLALLSEAIVLLFIFAVLASVEPALAFGTAALLGLTALIFVQSVKPVLERTGVARSHSLEGTIRWVNQALGGIKEVKLLGCEAFFVKAFEQSARVYANAGLTANTLHAVPRLLTETVAVIAVMVVVVVGVQQGRELGSMVPTLALFVLAAMRIMPSVNRMTPAVNLIRYWMPALHAVREGLRSAGQARAEGTREEEYVPAPPQLLQQALRAQDVSFRYPGASRWALHGVTLSIPRGSSAAFMGPSGAGKSTLVDLLLGLVDPNEGRIEIDGTPISRVRRVWQRHIGYVPQTIYLLDDTVRNNIALGVASGDIDDEHVWRAVRQARLAQLIERQPLGLDTPVGERGVRFSGGERQRLGIARALYRNPEVLVFDEATSALDVKTETEIANTIASLAGDKTVIIVAHRLTTVSRCEHVFFLDDGRLVDQGQLDGLLANNAGFRTMVGSARA